jgi:hypothetical protein
LFDREQFTEKQAQAALDESQIGTAADLSRFGTAYGFIRLAAIDKVGFVKYQRRKSGDGRGMVIVRFIGVTSWQEVEECKRDMGFVFRQLDAIPLDDSPTPDALVPRELHYELQRNEMQREEMPVQMTRDWNTLIQVLTSLIAGTQVVVVGYDRLEDQLALVKSLWSLLPGPLARDLSFVTGALSLSNIKVRLVFAPLSPFPSMGRLLRHRSGERYTLSYYPPDQEGPEVAGRRACAKRYASLLYQGIEQDGWDKFSTLIQNIAVDPSARLDRPESFVEHVEQSLGPRLFRSRKKGGQVTPKELADALQCYYGQMSSEELEEYVIELLRYYGQRRLQSEDIRFLGELLPSLSQQGRLDALRVGQAATNICMADGLDLETARFLLDMVMAIFPCSNEQSPAHHQKVLCEFFIKLYQLGVQSSAPSLYALFQPYAGKISRQIIEQTFQTRVKPSKIRDTYWEKCLRDWSDRLSRTEPQASGEKAILKAALIALCKTLVTNLADDNPLQAVQEWSWLVSSKVLQAQEAVQLFPCQTIHAQKCSEKDRRDIATQILREIMSNKFAGVEPGLISTSSEFLKGSGFNITLQVLFNLYGNYSDILQGLLARCEQELADSDLFMRLCLFVLSRRPQLFDGDAARTLYKLAERERRSLDLLRKILRTAASNDGLSWEDIADPLLMLAHKLDVPDVFLTILEKIEGRFDEERIAEKVRMWCQKDCDSLLKTIQNSNLRKVTKQLINMVFWDSMPAAVSKEWLKFSIEFLPPLDKVREKNSQIFQELADQLWHDILNNDTDSMRIEFLRHLIRECTRIQDASVLIELNRMFEPFKQKLETYFRNYQIALEKENWLGNSQLQCIKSIRTLIQHLEEARCTQLAQITHEELLKASSTYLSQSYVQNLIPQTKALESALTFLNLWNRSRHAHLLQLLDEKSRQELSDTCERIQKALYGDGGFLRKKESDLKVILQEISQASSSRR